LLAYKRGASCKLLNNPKNQTGDAMAWASISISNLLSLMLVMFVFFMHEVSWRTVAIGFCGVFFFKGCVLLWEHKYKALREFSKSLKSEVAGYSIAALVLFVAYRLGLNFVLKGREWNSEVFFKLMMVCIVISVACLSLYLLAVMFKLKKE
jgi:hypothetical protein